VAGSGSVAVYEESLRTRGGASWPSILGQKGQVNINVLYQNLTGSYQMKISTSESSEGETGEARGGRRCMM
jgi:hypothetical protein